MVLICCGTIKIIQNIRYASIVMKLDMSTVNEVAQCCFNLYNKLSKTGKPIEKEWTVLSCVILFDLSTKKHEVVSLGTGSKCIGATKMSPAGDILNDSHAEVFARRGFLLYLYEKLLANDNSLFTFEKGMFKLNEGKEIIFYSSQMPCGDASIISKTGEVEQYGDIIENKRQADDDICDTVSKKVKAEIDDVYRTGAKCLPNSEQDPKEAGSNYHLLGQVRTKPGRGDRTLSVSCSDKMAKWVHLGIQGSLLDMIMTESLYIKHFIFGSGVPYSEETLNRALLKRNNTCLITSSAPEFYQCDLIFPHIRSEDNVRPAPGSIVWVKTKNQVQEVAVQGRKLGLTKKKACLPVSSLYISKYQLYTKFLQVLDKHTVLKKKIFGNDCSSSRIPYNEMKKKSKRYRENWFNIHKVFFKSWTKKPDIWIFCGNC